MLARSVDGDDVSRGDLVVFTAPGCARSACFKRIMRVIAIGGDAVGEEDGVITIDGEPVRERYLPAGMFTAVPAGEVEALVVARWWPVGDFGGF